MIKVNKDFNDIPNHLKNDGKSYNHEDVKSALSALYHKKCCFCEQEVEYWEVEHYRPKNEVKECPQHTGYHWLRLEWSNLLYSCKTCNAGVGGKHTKFPILDEVNNRIYTASANLADNIADSAFLQNEGALLLHPEVDEPENHLTVLSDGKLEPVNNSLKGKATIEICNLNRDYLQIKKRQRIINKICRKLIKKINEAINICVNTPIENEDRGKVLMTEFKSIFDQMKKNSTSSKIQFALVHRCLYRKFDSLIEHNKFIQELTPSYISAIKQTFAQYKSQNP